MKTETFDNIVNEQLSLCSETLIVKAREYATHDRLHNFKQAAALQQVSLREALGGMMAKHTVSIYDMIDHPNVDFTEELWDEKITDHINYLLLLKAVVMEEKSKLSQAKTTEAVLVTSRSESASAVNAPRSEPLKAL